jgi:hypothetical protein
MEPAISSTPKACGVLSYHPRRRRAHGARYGDLAGGEEWRSLPGFSKAFELVTEVSEVARIDGQAEHFLDHRQEVRQGANSCPGLESQRDVSSGVQPPGPSLQ